MVIVLHRTADPPVEYRASTCSCAYLFHIICWIIIYIGPILICAFFTFWDSYDSVDLETPVIDLDQIYSISGQIDDASTFSYDYSQAEKAENIVGMSLQPMMESGINTGFIVGTTINAQSIRAIQVLFGYTVRLSRFSPSKTRALGLYTFSSVHGFSSLTVSGPLKLEQNQVIEFRGSFSQSNMKISNPITVHQLQMIQENSSALYYVDWEDPVVRYGPNPLQQSSIELTIRKEDLRILHSSPLVNSIEEVITMFLSTQLLLSIVFRFIEKQCYQKGILKTWVCPMYFDPSEKRQEFY